LKPCGFSLTNAEWELYGDGLGRPIQMLTLHIAFDASVFSQVVTNAAVRSTFTSWLVACGLKGDSLPPGLLWLPGDPDAGWFAERIVRSTQSQFNIPCPDLSNLAKLIIMTLETQELPSCTWASEGWYLRGAGFVGDETQVEFSFGEPTSHTNSFHYPIPRMTVWEVTDSWDETGRCLCTLKSCDDRPQVGECLIRESDLKRILSAIADQGIEAVLPMFPSQSIPLTDLTSSFEKQKIERQDAYWAVKGKTS